MKLLIIGIDGGTRKILEGMPMPFTHDLLRNGCSEQIREDLFSRGWAEILSGKHASATGAYYMMPFCDGTYRFSTSYNRKDLVSENSAIPIWKLLNDRGHKVGILNVPTTAPAPEVDGFVVAGGGGGLKASNAIPASMVHPECYKNLLEKRGYVADMRLPANCKTVSEFAAKLTAAQSLQKDTYIDFCERDKPDMGFFCFRMTTELQYLAKSEIEKIISKATHGFDSDSGNTSESALARNLVKHYKAIDLGIRELVEVLNPDHFLILGDHSTSDFLYEGNLDAWLHNNSFLEFMTPLEDKLNDTAFKMARLVNRYASKMKLSKAWLSHRRPITRFSRNRTRAFGTFYDTGNFAGIFVNDSDRFRGPVSTAADVESLVEEICSKFNEESQVTKYGLTAVPYRSEFVEEKYSIYMPDIKIEKPDTIYFSGRRSDFIVENSNYGNVCEELAGVRYPHTGLKGRDPIFCFDPSLAEFIHEDDPSDLTLAYKIVDRLFA